MGRPTSITFESVSLAAEKLIAEQKPCKLTDIHGIVGGSLSTVSKYWKMWKEKNGTEVLKQPQGSGPTAQLNDVFTAELNLQISLIHEKYEAKFQEKDAELEYIQSALETSESQVDELNNNLISLKEKMSFMAGEKSAAEARSISVEKKLEELQLDLLNVIQEKSRLEGALNEANVLIETKLEEIALKNSFCPDKDKKKVTSKTTITKSK